MTAQISDRVWREEKKYDLCGISGVGLFSPAKHYLHLTAISSACWRGFHADYQWVSEKLLLRDLWVGLEGSDKVLAQASRGPVVFNKRPVFDPLRSCFVYNGLDEPMTYTGGLLLGADFIDELYVHMGFHPAWKYRDVRELIFLEGNCTEDHDRSDEVAAVREKVSNEPPEPGYGASPGAIEAWVAQCFSRDYRQRNKKERGRSGTYFGSE